MKTFTFNNRIKLAWILAVAIALMSISCGTSKCDCPEYVEPFKPNPGLVKAKMQRAFHALGGGWYKYSSSSPIIEYIDPMYKVGEIFAPEGDENGTFYMILEVDSVLTK
jgi:hypothetical protein